MCGNQILRLVRSTPSTRRLLDVHPTHWLISTQVIIFMAFGIGAVAGDSIDKAEAMTAAKKAWDVVHLKSAIDALAPSGYDGGKAGAAATVSFEDVAFAYPTRADRPVYEQLTFSIAAGEVCALVGESGSGKSTAVQLLLRYYDVGGGRICVDGTDVRGWDVTALRGSIGLVSQEPALFTGTIADNIKYGKPDASLEDVRHAASLANALQFIDALPEGFDTQVGSRGIQLSGGQKQRVAIARAIVRKPRLLILDEATSALDAKSEQVVQAALDKLVAASSCTTLVIAHRLSTIRSASKICVFGKGGLLEQGTHDALLSKKSHYYALVAHQMAK